VTPYETPPAAPPGFQDGGRCWLLDDTQVDLGNDERVWFARRAELVAAGSGAAGAAQFSALFDPTYEQIEVHWIRVRRGDRTFDYAEPARFEVFRRERNLESQIFDGMHTLHVVLPDVRAGDVVESAYSVIGMRPSLRNRHAALIWFEWPVGVVDVRHRLRAPEHRIIRFKGFNDAPVASTTTENGVVDQRWRTVRRPGKDPEPLAPPGANQFASIQFSEWPDWASVVDAFAPAYLEDEGLAPDLAAEADKIGAAHAAPAERATAVLRFVQEHVRYLAIGIGDGGLVPRAIAAVWTNRYGDCKDAAKLYVALARRIGLDATPALVNTIEREGVENCLPSSAVFDHCIVRVRIDGASYWLDPTRPLQPSPLATIVQCQYGVALPLAAGSDALERMRPSDPIEQLDIREQVDLGGSPGVPVRYEWRITHRGARAEMVRAAFAHNGADSTFKGYADDVTAIWPKAKPLRQEVVRDDPALNEIETLEVYEIAEAWDVSEGVCAFSTHDFLIKNRLVDMKPEERRLPIYMGRPESAARRVDIRTTLPWNAGAWERTAECAAARYSTRFRMLGARDFELVQRLDIHREILPPEEASQYYALVSELRRSEVSLSDRIVNGEFASSAREEDSGSWRTVGAVIVVVLLVIYWLGRAFG
jgi:transglutaminase-like putative cysteine protease